MAGQGLPVNLLQSLKWDNINGGRTPRLSVLTRMSPPQRRQQQGAGETAPDHLLGIRKRLPTILQHKGENKVC